MAVLYMYISVMLMTTVKRLWLCCCGDRDDAEFLMMIGFSYNFHAKFYIHIAIDIYKCCSASFFFFFNQAFSIYFILYINNNKTNIYTK